jgi:hypothetical protein
METMAMQQIPFHTPTSMHGTEEAQGDPLLFGYVDEHLVVGVCLLARQMGVYSMAVVASQGAEEFQVQKQTFDLAM